MTILLTGCGSRGAPPPATIAAKGVPFNGTNNYFTYDTTNQPVDSSKLLMSFWLRMAAVGDYTIFVNNQTTPPYDIIRVYTSSVDGSISFQMGDGTISNTWAVAFNTPPNAYDGLWHHYCYSADSNFAPGLKPAALYIDGAAATVAGNNDTMPAFNAAFSIGNYKLAAYQAFGANRLYAGQIAEFYFAAGQYLDLSSASNRKKFLYAGLPVDLGTDGSAPTSIKPTIYHTLKAADFDWGFFLFNRGNGPNASGQGSFSIGNSVQVGT